MSSAVQDRTDSSSSALEERLDELIPRPAPTWRRVLGGGLIIAVAAIGSLLWSLGYIVPMKSLQNDSGGSSALWITVANAETPAAEPVLLLERRVFNRSNRDVRLVSIDLDADGAELVGVKAEAIREIDYGNCTTVGASTTCHSTTPGTNCTQVTRGNMASEVCETEPFDPSTILADAGGLPIVVPAHGDIDVYVLIRPTKCTGPNQSPWGELHGTYDFGEGAFPPFSNSEPIGEYLFDEWSTPTIIGSDGPRAMPAGEDTSVLAEACRALGL